MQVTTDLRERPIDANQLVRTALRMRTRKTDALDARDGRDSLQQTWKRLRVTARTRRVLLVPGLVTDAVPQHALAQQTDLLDAAFGQCPNLRNDLARRTGILMSTHIGHDAIAAAVVTANQNRHIALEGPRRPSPLRVGMRVHAGRHLIVANLQKALLPGLRNLADEMGNETEPTRPHREIELRQTLEDIRAHTLDRTPHHTGNLLRSNHVARLADGLLLGLLPNGAAVDHDLGLVLRRDLLVPRSNHERLDRLGIADIHLAPVSMDQKLHCGRLYQI